MAYDNNVVFIARLQEDVRREAAECIEQDEPIANVKAMADAVREFRKY
jgi:hypothetical protein